VANRPSGAGLFTRALADNSTQGRCKKGVAPLALRVARKGKSLAGGGTPRRIYRKGKRDQGRSY